MIDGKAYKTLRRHLAGHDLTPEEYRTRYNFKADYPMVAPSYSEARRSIAQKIILGVSQAVTPVRRPCVGEARKPQAQSESASRTRLKANLLLTR